jgi:hypothetical protein
VLLHLPFCSPGRQSTQSSHKQSPGGGGVGAGAGVRDKGPLHPSRMHVPLSLTYPCHLPASLPCVQLSGQKWTWQGLNTLCWAIGSISGSMADEQENRFLVTVIR